MRARASPPSTLSSRKDLVSECVYLRNESCRSLPAPSAAPGTELLLHWASDLPAVRPRPEGDSDHQPHKQILPPLRRPQIVDAELAHAQLMRSPTKLKLPSAPGTTPPTAAKAP